MQKLLNMAIEIVDLPINSIVIFQSYVNVYQRVMCLYWFSIIIKIPDSKLTINSNSFLPAMMTFGIFQQSMACKSPNWETFLVM